jgi:two-component system response regulator PilR (NtrC family)
LDFDASPAQNQPRASAGPLVPALPEEGVDLDAYLAEVERQLLVAALEKVGGVRKDAAKLLRTTFRSLRYRLAKYGLGGDDDADLQEQREP